MCIGNLPRLCSIILCHCNLCTVFIVITVYCNICIEFYKENNRVLYEKEIFGTCVDEV